MQEEEAFLAGEGEEPAVIAEGVHADARPPRAGSLFLCVRARSSPVDGLVRRAFLCLCRARRALRWHAAVHGAACGRLAALTDALTIAALAAARGRDLRLRRAIGRTGEFVLTRSRTVAVAAALATRCDRCGLIASGWSGRHTRGDWRLLVGWRGLRDSRRCDEEDQQKTNRKQWKLA